VTGRGRHISTSAIALRLPGTDGWVIDTPGVRSFGLSHVRPDRIVAAFPDLDSLTSGCPRGCSHAAGEPECALDEAVQQGQLSSQRLESFRRMLGSGQ
jgi:ribosome biogenesis GTPase / thiamine phosphate phosphatase